MTLLHRLASVLSWLFNRTRAERRLDDELQGFVEMATAEKIREGVPPLDARRQAILELGGVEQVKEHVRTSRHGAVLDEVARDVRYALRMIVRSPGVTATIVLTLALGIGANTAIFSLVDGLLLRSLPVKDPGRLAMLIEDAPSPQTTWTYPIWQRIQESAGLFDGAFAWAQYDAQFDLSRGGETQRVRGMWASANTFSTLGVTAALGRTFTAADDVPGGGAGGPVAVISHDFWQRHFGGAPDVVGRALTLERIPFTIVGVTQKGFLGLSVGSAYDVAIPLGAEPLLRGARESRLDRRTSWWLTIVVRLKPGQTLEAANAVVRGLQPQIREATLPSQPAAADEHLRQPLAWTPAAAGRSELRRQYRRPLVVMMVVVGLVLLIACANIVNLLLARATARAHEWSVRLALGVSRGRLARQLLTESVLLAALGAAAGLVVAHWGSRLLVEQLASQAVVVDLGMDWRVLAFTAAVTIAAALIVGVAPAWRATRAAPVDAMKHRGRGSAGGGRLSVPAVLVVAQVILSVVLVVCAGLFLRTFSSLMQAPLGFDRDRVLLVDIDARRSGAGPQALPGIYEQVRQRVSAVPGAASAGVSLVAPLSGAIWSWPVEVSGSSKAGTGPVDGPEGFGYTEAAIPDSSPLALFNAVTPGWMSTYGTPVIAGRDISDADGPGAAGVALVNQAFARKFLDGANPIGQSVRTTRGTETSTREIVGLVSDAVYRSVREPMLPTVYVPLAQYDAAGAIASLSEVTLGVRTASQPPAALARSVAAAIAEIEPGLALTIRPLATQVNDTFVQERLLALLSASFGALALVMAAVGLYGVTSYAVSLRRTEIGIRMALGATRGSVVRLVLGRVSVLVGIGIIAGVGLGAWGSRFLATLLFGLAPGDPAALFAAVATLAAVAVLAGWLPARRAARLDPARVLTEG